MKLIGLVGCGGFASEVMPLLETMYQNDIKAQLVFVGDHLNGQAINGCKVMSDEDFLSADCEKYFNIAIADSKLRERLAKNYLATGALPTSIIAQQSVNLKNNSIGEGAILCAYTTITANAKIGKYFHCNLYSYVAHDCVVGDFVTFAPSVHCNGGVIIENHAYIGTGAIIKQGTPEKPIVIGEGAIVGMGAVVTKSVAPFTTVIGNPAKVFQSV